MLEKWYNTIFYYYRIKLLAETDYMEEVINGRKKEIDQIENIMLDINSMAKDLAMETTKQGQSLQTLETNIIVARDNTKGALKELGSAQKNQKSGGKILLIILAIIIIIVIIVCAVVFTRKWWL